jgi:integrase
MANVFKKLGSPFWYARFQIKGKDYALSTEKTKKNEAKDVLRRFIAEKKGSLSVSDWFEGLMAELEKQAHDSTRQERKRDVLMMRQDMARQLMGAQREKLAIGDAWQAWLDNPKKRNPGPATIQGYLSEWERFIKWTKGQSIKFLHELTPAMTEDYAADLWKSRVAPGTYNAHVNFLKSLFRVLKTKAGIVANPWEEIPTLPKEREGRRMFTPDELKKVCETATGSLRYMIAVGLYTGMRLGDVVTLRWDAIRLEEGFIEIMPMKTRRTNKKIRLPIHPVLEVMLKELRTRSKGEYLFPEDRVAYGKDRCSITQKFQALLGDCGIKTTETAASEHRRRAIIRTGFHSLRHSFVSLCAANRVPQVAIMELVGHGSPAMTNLYSHAGDEQKAKAIAGLPTFAFENAGTENVAALTVLPLPPSKPKDTLHDGDREL